jgi:hypothetical protein
MAALAAHAGVGVAAEDGGVALHAGALDVVGVGQAHRLRPLRGLRGVELLQGVVVGGALEGEGLFLLPLARLALVVVAAHALARAQVGLGQERHSTREEETRQDDRFGGDARADSPFGIGRHEPSK